MDISKNRITNETIQLLIALAEEANLPAKIEAMYGGDKVNITEDRAVIHIARRNRANTLIIVDGSDDMPVVNSVLGKNAHIRHGSSKWHSPWVRSIFYLKLKCMTFKVREY